MKYLPIILGTFLLLLPTACSSIEYPTDHEPRMVITGEQVPFYLRGPAQGNGADRMLHMGDEVKVLRKDFGFSFVQISDGLKGYVGNEFLVPAPPEPSPTPTPASWHNAKDEAKNFTNELLPSANLPDATLPPPAFRY